MIKASVISVLFLVALFAQTRSDGESRLPLGTFVVKLETATFRDAYFTGISDIAHKHNYELSIRLLDPWNHHYIIELNAENHHVYGVVFEHSNQYKFGVFPPRTDDLSGLNICTSEITKRFEALNQLDGVSVVFLDEKVPFSPD